MARQSTDLQQKWNTLNSSIQKWRQTQLAYTPAVASLLFERLSATAPENDHAEHVPLFSPSSIPVSLQDVTKLVAAQELWLHKAQGEEALDDVCCGHHIITGICHLKKLNVCGAGNKPNTQMHNLYNWLQRWTQHTANRYWAAWEAVEQLKSNGTWYNHFQRLDQSDICGPVERV